MDLPEWQEILGQLPVRFQTRAALAIKKVTMRLRANFDKRIMQRVRNDPCRLLWRGKGRPGDLVPERARLAHELVEADPARLHAVARKVWHLFLAAVSVELNHLLWVLQMRGMVLILLLIVMLWARLL